MFKGSRKWSKVLHIFALPQKGNRYHIGMLLFHGKLHAPYRKIEMLKLPHVLFWVVQNFRPFSRPFKATVENSYLNKFDVE